MTSTTIPAGVRLRRNAVVDFVRSGCTSETAVFDFDYNQGKVRACAEIDGKRVVGTVTNIMPQHRLIRMVLDDGRPVFFAASEFVGLLS